MDSIDPMDGMGRMDAGDPIANRRPWIALRPRTRKGDTAAASGRRSKGA